MAEYLVVQLARFGDVVQTKRLVSSLRQTGSVALCVDEALAELAALVYPDCTIIGLPIHAAEPVQILNTGAKLFRQLGKRGYDAVYLLNHAGLGQSLARLFDPRIVRGYVMDKGQSLRSNWVRLAFRWMGDRRSNPINLVDYWAWFCDNPVPGQAVNPRAEPGGQGLGIVLAGQSARRSLPPNLLAPIIHAVAQRLDYPTVKLFGTAKEEKIGRQLMVLLPPKIARNTNNLAGKTDWTSLIEELRGLDLLLSPDTGTAHLAAHLGVPVEAFFISSAWVFETGPYGLGHKVWQTVKACAPCLERAACPYDAGCTQLFAEPSFLAALSGKKTRTTLNLTELRSDFDALGQTWITAESRRGQEGSMALRTLLGEYLGIWPRTARILPEIYQEADWILPQYRP